MKNTLMEHRAEGGKYIKMLKIKSSLMVSKIYTVILNKLKL